MTILESGPPDWLAPEWAAAEKVEAVGEPMLACEREGEALGSLTEPAFSPAPGTVECCEEPGKGEDGTNADPPAVAVRDLETGND